MNDGVQRFLDDAKRQCLDDFERALWRIAKLRTSRATMIAEEALGIGPYWRKGFGPVPTGYLGYLWTTFKIWLRMPS